MNAISYWLLALGTICVGVNISINGVEILFSTCVGYALMGIGAWNLREEGPIFRYAPIAAAILALLSFPDLFRNAVLVRRGQQDPLYLFDLWTFYPFSILHGAFFAGVAAAIARQARKSGDRSVFGVATVAAVAVVMFETPWFSMPFPSRPYYIAFFVVTTAYFALLTWSCAWAATTLP